MNKKDLFNLIKEVKSELEEVNGNTTQPQQVVQQPNQVQAANVSNSTTPIVFPNKSLPVMQALSDMLYFSKSPQYADLKPWLQSLGVKVK